MITVDNPMSLILPNENCPGNSTGFRIIGAAGDDSVGVAGYGRAAGDVNSDGIDDIVVGGYTTAGLAYVFFGHTVAMRGFADVYLSDFTSGTYGYKIIGATAATCHYSNQAGDVNGDGYDDLVVGCSGTYIVYTLFGHAAPYTDVSLSTFSSSASSGFKFTGSAGDGTGGMPAGGGGDFNNDGYADVFIGAPYHDESGRTDCGAVYLVLGHIGTAAFADVDASSATFGTGVGRCRCSSQ